MFDRFVRSRRRAPEPVAGTTVSADGDVARPVGADVEPPVSAPDGTSDAAVAATEQPVPDQPLPDQPVPEQPVPEQPVPLPAIPGARRARVGVVLPARRRLLPALALPIPRVPKRAIFAVGICAGLAAPSVTRQLAGRALLAALGPGRTAASRPGVPAALEATTVEIIRVSSVGQRPGQTAAAVGKLLEQLTR